MVTAVTNRKQQTGQVKLLEVGMRLNKRQNNITQYT